MAMYTSTALKAVGGMSMAFVVFTCFNTTKSVGYAMAVDGNESTLPRDRAPNKLIPPSTAAKVR